ncbi:hypothetical protein LZC95_23055 [Pendulispora brunnea]|uniref:Uncharacterized protein n=1 Tax=Pendulispora brunnea TaxID=2905690 RepID=A0ABZ2KPS2_9BACT
MATLIGPLACLVACRQGDPPTAGVSSAAPIATMALATPPRARTDKDASAPRDAAAPSPAPDAAVSDDPSLPQTHDRPNTDAAFDARVRALFDGIVNDDPDRAMPFFFPLAAYQQVKAIATPERDWKRRLVANYVRDIHALAQNLKELGPDARFARVEVPRQARWVEPDEEYNRIGYYRVYGTQIFWTSRDGKEHAVRISSMISWRGQWYVVHLTGFK